MEINNIRRFRKTLRAFEREISIQNKFTSCGGVSLTQCHTLLEIENLEKTNVGELASTLNLDKSTVSRTIDGLVNIGLVSRTIPPNNRRASLVQLTKQGKQTCKLINGENDEFFLSVFSSLDTENINVFLKTFEQISKTMKAMNSNRSKNK